MQIDFAHSDNTDVPAGAIAGILHDLWQPLTALECSLELALMPCTAATARSLTTSALQAARRMHVLANQAQAIERSCHQYRSPRVLSLGEFASKFGLALLLEDAGKNIYVDTDGVRAAFHRLAGNTVFRGSINCVGSVIRIALKLDNTIHAPQLEIPTRDEPICPATFVAALIESLGGRSTLSRDTAVIEFLTH